MALKKSELYSSLWSGCDELRGGMDASQYKDYVALMDGFLLQWKAARQKLNQIPVRHEDWDY